MGWWSDLFKVKDVVIDSGLPKISAPLPMPKVKQPKPEKDISEPVISFIACVENDPKRFRIKNMSVFDRKTGKFFSLKYGSSYITGPDYECIIKLDPEINTNWMSDDEKEYVHVELKRIQQQKVKNFKNKQRQKYIEIYAAKEND